MGQDPLITPDKLEWLEEKGSGQAVDEQLSDEGELRYYKKHPIPLNKAQENDLRQTGLLSEEQVLNFINYRKRFGKLLDIHELQAIPGWDLYTIKRLIPYVTLYGGVDSYRFGFHDLANAAHSLLIRYGRDMPVRASGKSDQDFLGSPDRLLCGYGFKDGTRLQAGFLAKKDAGERLFRAPCRNGFDHFSFYVQAGGKSRINNVILGDFTVNLGQGLVQWQNMAFGKSGSIFTIKRQAPALKPYRSSGEFNFFRGAAIGYAAGHYNGIFFISYRRLDANRTDSTNEKGQTWIRSLITGGYHRTEQEWSERKNVGLYSVGAQLKYRFQGGHLALNGVQHRFTLPFLPSRNASALYAEKGRLFTNVSIDFSATIRQAHLFGECAMNAEKGLAGVAGMLVSLHRNFDVALLYRNITPAYHALFSSAFLEKSEVNNEKGFYTGFQCKPVSGIKLEGFLDLYRFPWISYRFSLPGEGAEYWIRLDYEPSKKMQFSARFRFSEDLVESTDGATPLTGYSVQRKSQLRLQMAYQLTDRVLFTQRLEQIRLLAMRDAAHAEGFLSFAELAYAFQPKPLSMVFRAQYFETANYLTRVYAYEKDVIPSGVSRNFYGKGWRWYLLFAMAPGRNKKANGKLKFSLKIARSYTLKTAQQQRPVGFEGPEPPFELRAQAQFFF